MRSVVIVLAAVASCQRTEPKPDQQANSSPMSSPAPEPAPAPVTPPHEPPRPATPVDTSVGHRRDITAIVGTAYRVAIGDLDGNGTNEIALGDAQNVRVLDASGKELATTPAAGGVQLLVIADGELFVGSGITRDHMTAPAKVTGYHLAHGKLTEDPVLAPTTSRAEITAIVPSADHALVIAYYESKYMVKSVLARRDGAAWKVEDLAVIRMATAYARGDVDGDGKPDLVVGRTYGDDKGVDGDAFLLRPDGTRVPIPTTRGVRDLVLADTDGDGQLEIFLADGWHQNYAASARGLLTKATFAHGAFKSSLVEDIAGQYTAGKILVADLDGDGKPELVTQGSSAVRSFQRKGATWTGVTFAGSSKDIAAGELDGKKGAEVLVLADKSEIISFP